MSKQNDTSELDALLMHVVKGDASKDQLKQLKEAASQSSEVLDYCRDLLVVSAGLERLIYEDDRQAEQWLEKTLHSEMNSTHTQRSARPWIRQLTSMAAVVIIGALGSSLLIYRLLNPYPTFALLKHAHAAKWGNTDMSTRQGTRLKQGDYHLLQGVAEIDMKSGAKLVVQGPCQFAMDDRNRMSLTEGVISVNTPATAKGFTVHTPNADIVVYGTEFGVTVNKNGTMETHVFSGTVEVQAGTPPTSKPFTKGQVAAVDTTGFVRSGLKKANPSRFLRKMPTPGLQACPGKHLDLADIAGAGNGFGTGTLRQGIDPANGQALDSFSGTQKSDRQGRFVTCPDRPYVDGVFVPDRKQGPVRISSTGLIFADCPATSGLYYDGIFNGRSVTTANPDQQERLDGTLYGIPEHPALSLHPNAGITYDLNRMRQDNPGVRFKSFKALCGVSESSAAANRRTTKFWVLIDGEVRYEHECLPGEFNTGLFNLPLKGTDRFLTLVTTSPDNQMDSWGFFGDPMLELVPAENKGGRCWVVGCPVFSFLLV